MPSQEGCSDHIYGPHLYSKPFHIHLGSQTWTQSTLRRVERRQGSPSANLLAMFLLMQLKIWWLKVLVQNRHVFLQRAAFNPFSAKPVFVLGIALAQAHIFTLGRVKIDEIYTGPLVKPVKVPLHNIPSLQCVELTPQLGVVSKLTNGALNPIIQGTGKDVKELQTQY